MEPELTERQKAFNKLFDDWRARNIDVLCTNLTSRTDLARGAMAAAWNAAHDSAEEVIQTLLNSAHPHPVEHPTMTAAWKKAEEFIK